MRLLAFILPLLVYVLAVACAFGYKWRWLCALFVTLINLALTGLLTFIVSASDWGDGTTGGASYLIIAPVTGYFLLLAVAVVTGKKFVVCILAVIAHILLLTGVPGWGLEPVVYLLTGVIIALSAPIWLLAHHAKPRKAAGANVAA